MNDYDAVRELANSNIHEVLELLGVEFSDRYKYLNGPCMVHGGDNITAWSWLIDKGIWRCFTHECEEEYGRDIFGLIRGLKGLNAYDAKRWLEKRLGGGLSEEEKAELLEHKSNREFIGHARKKKKRTRVYNPSCLDKLLYHDYLERRGYPEWLVHKYHAGVGSRVGRAMSNRIIFPLLNISNEIVGFTGRTILDDWQERRVPKWRHSNDCDLDGVLFNLNWAQEYIRKKGEVILVEGPLDVLRLEQYGIHNSVGLLGKTLHNGQIGLLLRIPTFKVIVALDADTAGRAGARKISKVASAFFDVEVKELPEGKDCGDLTEDEARELFYDKQRV